jgi:hypothetical protein
LFFLVVARSGERKSDADYTFSKATGQWQLEIRDRLLPEIKIGEILYQAWKMKRDGFLNQEAI